MPPFRQFHSPRVLAAALTLGTLLAAPSADAQSLGGLSNVYSGDGIATFDNAVRTSSIVVSGFGPRTITTNGLGQSVVVRLNNLTHTWVGDLSATLIFTPLVGTPRSMGLFFRPGQGVGNPPSTFGSSDDLNGSYSFGEFTDAGFQGDFVDFARFSPATVIPGGDYYATRTGGGEYASPFETFGGLSPDGTWTLELRDAATPDAGALGSWNLAFETTSVVPEPSTYAMLATGLLAVGGAVTRRRRRGA